MWGPEQNLTYIAATRPRMAFVVDIRRQAAMQHLMFKALFELAFDRAEFISLLFAKPRPAHLDRAHGHSAHLAGVRARERRPGSGSQDRETHRASTHRHARPRVDAGGISRSLPCTRRSWVWPCDFDTRLRRIWRRRQQLHVRGFDRMGRGRTGQVQSFLSTDENYRTVKSLHERNLIVPLTGDFGGPKALRALGAYLKRHGGVVSAFYVSNVEQYLFQDGKAAAFYENVSELPIDAMSVFIRPYCSAGACRHGPSARSFRSSRPPRQARCAGTSIHWPARAVIGMVYVKRYRGVLPVQRVLSVLHALGDFRIPRRAFGTVYSSSMPTGIAHLFFLSVCSTSLIGVSPWPHGWFTLPPVGRLPFVLSFKCMLKMRA